LNENVSKAAENSTPSLDPSLQQEPMATNLRFRFVQALRRWLSFLGVSTAHPWAFGVVALYVAAWLIVSPRSFDWQAMATIATWIMTLFIQRAEHRDTQAIHAKLDELLRVDSDARTDLIAVDRSEPEVIESHRKQQQEDTAGALK
jgi:low affinity Fe/Cu permease